MGTHDITAGTGIETERETHGGERERDRGGEERRGEEREDTTTGAE